MWHFVFLFNFQWHERIKESNGVKKNCLARSAWVLVKNFLENVLTKDFSISTKPLNRIYWDSLNEKVLLVYQSISTRNTGFFSEGSVRGIRKRIFLNNFSNNPLLSCLKSNFGGCCCLFGDSLTTRVMIHKILLLCPFTMFFSCFLLNVLFRLNRKCALLLKCLSIELLRGLLILYLSGNEEKETLLSCWDLLDLVARFRTYNNVQWHCNFPRIGLKFSRKKEVERNLR